MANHGNDDGSTHLAARPIDKEQHRERENDALPHPILPSEIMREILLTLPVKFLLRSMCVCKKWNSIISDAHFAKAHLFNSKVDPTLSHHHLLLTDPDLEREVSSCSVKSLFHNQLTSQEGVNFVLRHKYDIIGLCNGLVCVVAGKYFGLWNPSMRLVSRKCHYLDVEDSWGMLYHGFGYDPVSDNYKVVFVYAHREDEDDEVEFEDEDVDEDDDDDDEDEIEYDDNDNDDDDDEMVHYHTTLTRVYSFGDKSWTTFENMRYDPTNRIGKYVNDTLNWVALRPGSPFPHEWVILSFNLKHNTFGEISPPDFGYDNPLNPIQVVLKDCLCVYYANEETHLVVWMMKEYGIRETWTKLVVIPYVNNSVPYKQPLCMSDSDKVLVSTTDNRIVVYDPKEGRLEYPNIQGDNVGRDQYVYIESLISPSF